jgi:hypothetical protein
MLNRSFPPLACVFPSKLSGSISFASSSCGLFIYISSSLSCALRSFLPSSSLPTTNRWHPWLGGKGRAIIHNWYSQHNQDARSTIYNCLHTCTRRQPPSPRSSPETVLVF